MKHTLLLLGFTLLASAGAAFAGSLDELAEQLLSPKVRAGLENRDLALVHADDPVSSDFARIVRGKLGAFAVVVSADQKIIEGEIKRQESGLVDDDEIISIGHQKGADIVVQLILCRTPGEKTKIKAMLTAVHVETNTLAASNAVETDPPRGLDLGRLPFLQKEDEIGEVRRMTLAIVNSKAGSIHDDPLPPPKEPLRLPQINWRENFFLGGSGMLDFLLVYGNGGSDTANAETGGHRLSGVRIITLEYGRLGPGWGIGDRLCFALSPLMAGDFGYGLDISAGYRLSSLSYDFGAWNWIWFSVIAGGGFMVFSDNGDAPFVPYAQIKLNVGPAHLDLKFSPVESSWFSLATGWYMQWSW
jgi:hypothetical protein